MGKPEESPQQAKKLGTEYYTTYLNEVGNNQS